jgi:hypothetical protein
VRREREHTQPISAKLIDPREPLRSHCLIHNSITVVARDTFCLCEHCFGCSLDCKNICAIVVVKSVELKLSIPDVWSRQLFIALCRRYGLRPFRHRRMHRQTIMIKAPKSFVEQVLWPEFQELNAALIAYLSEITEKVIREEVHGETGEAEEADEPTRIGR